MADLLSLSQELGRYPEALYHQESEQAVPPGFLYAALDKSAYAAFFTERSMKLIIPTKLVSNISTYSLRSSMSFDQKVQPAGEECVTGN